MMDLYPILANRTVIENNPFLQVKFREPVDIQRLYAAVDAALKRHPLFGCKLCRDKDFYLETNEADFTLIRAAEEERPLEFGDNTKGFLWQICYDEYSMSFEWCHGLSDGRGGYAFLVSVLHDYFGVPEEVDIALEPGLESFYDREEKGLPSRLQKNGFKASDVPYISRGYRTDCHILKVPVKNLLEVAKKSDSSPATIIAPLFSMALRKHIRPGAKNRNVCCNVVVDCRKPMGFLTMHNCILPKNITYIDRFDTMDYSLVSTIYRAILDLAVQPENVVVEATKMVDTIKTLAAIRPRWLQKLVSKAVAKTLKHQDSNFTFTYLGKMKLPKVIMDGIEDFSLRSWTDLGKCNIAAIDFNGTLIMNICENYRDKGISPILSTSALRWISALRKSAPCPMSRQICA